MRSRKTNEILKKIKRRHRDLSIIDGPALADGIDAIVVSGFVERTLFVVEQGIVRQQKPAEAVGHLGTDKIPGAVFNKRVA